MAYIRHIPAPPLNRYVHDIYYQDSPAPYPRLKVIPMPSLHLMVNFGAPFKVHRADESEDFAICTESWCSGMWSSYHTIDWQPDVRFYGVHFNPCGAYPFLRLPLSELHNQVVPLDALWGNFAVELRERLYAVPIVQAGFALIEQALLTRLDETAYALEIVRHATLRMAACQGSLSIRTLSEQTGISHNHLGRHFRQIVGIPPKELARIYRFAGVLQAIDTARQVDWLTIAQCCGYYDQSHFNKDFLAFTGHNPSDYLRLRRMDITTPQLSGSLGQMATG